MSGGQRLGGSYGVRLLEAFGVGKGDGRACSFAVFRKQVAGGWRAFTFDLQIPFFFVSAPGARFGEVRSLASGIGAENYVFLADVGSAAVLVLKRARKGDNVPRIVLVRREEDFERAAQTIRKFNFVSDELTAHSSIDSVVDLLRVGAERYYTNRGLFSNHYLRERLFKGLSERGRSPQKESVEFFGKFYGDVPTTPERARVVLSVLGFDVVSVSGQGHEQYALKHRSLE